MPEVNELVFLMLDKVDFSVQIGAFAWNTAHMLHVRYVGLANPDVPNIINAEADLL